MVKTSTWGVNLAVAPLTLVMSQSGRIPSCPRKSLLRRLRTTLHMVCGPAVVGGRLLCKLESNHKKTVPRARAASQ